MVRTVIDCLDCVGIDYRRLILEPGYIAAHDQPGTPKLTPFNSRACIHCEDLIKLVKDEEHKQSTDHCP